VDRRQATGGSAGEGPPDRQHPREPHPPQPQGPRRCLQWGEPHQRPPRRSERRGGRERPPCPCHQCLHVCRRCSDDSWEGVGRGWGCAPDQGSSDGARARRAPHGGGDYARGGARTHGGARARGGCSVGSRSSARGDNPRPEIEGGGKEGERGTRLAGHGATRAWGRGGGSS
jgi:hypothetical protein